MIVKAEEGGVRLDAYLSEKSGLSRSAVQRLILDGRVTLEGRAVKNSEKSRAGAEYRLALPPREEAEPKPQPLELDIVYEDEDLIAVNKPQGMVVHPAAGHADNTLVNALLYHCGGRLSGLGDPKRPGIVHRLDKDTSGLILAAKTDFAHVKLAAQLKERSMSRVYETIVLGLVKEREGTIDAPIGRHPVNRKKMAVIERGSRPAITHYRLLELLSGHSHLSCSLVTGRTHQIRVHLAHINHPILGDTVYGAKRPRAGLKGQCLHSKSLGFIHPRTAKPMVLSTELPEYFVKQLTKLMLKG